MRFLSVLILSAFLSPVNTSETRFIRWWSNHDENILVNDQSARSYSAVTELCFSTLPEYQGTISPPSGLGPRIGKILVIFSRPNRSLLLATPQNSMKDRVYLDQEYVQTQKKCRADTSWLVSLPENTWTEIDLNPYCNMDYDEDGILIDLYWVSRGTTPYVDIRTNAMLCVPHHLYGWDGREKGYVLRARKCTGLRAVEDYAAGARMEQLPPVVQP